MIFAYIQESLSMMSLRPRSEGLSLMTRAVVPFTLVGVADESPRTKITKELDPEPRLGRARGTGVVTWEEAAIDRTSNCG